MSCPTYTSFGANSESTRLRQLNECVHKDFLLENPAPPTECPLKLPAQITKTITTRLESTRLLNKVIACPLYSRVPKLGCASGYTDQYQQMANIGGINQITQPVVTVSSGTFIAAKATAIAGNASGSKFIPTFFRGPSLPYVCPPAKTAQDPGVPQAPLVRCIPGSRVVA
jgi:hypothetical protein